MKKNAVSSVKPEQNGFVRARDLLAKETLLALCALAVFIFISALFDPGIGEDANRTVMNAHWRAPWIFAGIQVLLGFLPTFIAGILLPLLVLVFWAILPILDKQEKWQGFFVPEARFPIIRLFSLTIIAIFILVIYGTYF